ncbi:MAG: hypothetical protein ACKV2U_04220 [Bryobacteraceae bacterium]
MLRRVGFGAVGKWVGVEASAGALSGLAFGRGVLPTAVVGERAGAAAVTEIWADLIGAGNVA